MNLKWSTFLDKVYGCWIGKCVSGTIGAPYEGYKGILNVQYSSELIKDMLPNDDLDLQVLWLEVLEKKGANFTSEDLADIFAEKCPYLGNITTIIIWKVWAAQSVRKYGPVLRRETPLLPPHMLQWTAVWITPENRLPQSSI